MCKKGREDALRSVKIQDCLGKIGGSGCAETAIGKIPAAVGADPLWRGASATGERDAGDSLIRSYGFERHEGFISGRLSAETMKRDPSMLQLTAG